jgi:hypothetical protein
MSALEEAKAHLAKAREFLEAAHLSNDVELYSAATSNAVIAGTEIEGRGSDHVWLIMPGAPT